MLHQTEEALIEELSALRRRVAELEGAETARQRALIALGDSQRRLHTVVENLPIIVWAVDNEGIITLSEGQGLKRLGVTPNQLIGRSCFEVYRDVPKVGESIRRALAGDEFTAATSIHNAVFSGWNAPIWGPDGTIIGAHGVAIDITDQAIAEDRWQSLVQHAPDYICTCDRECRITFVNRVAPESLPLTPGDLVGQCFLPSAAPEHQALIGQKIAGVFDTGRPTNFEARWLMADGSYRWYESHVGPLIRNGQVVEAIIVGNDITERKQNEQELRALKDAFQTIAETLPGVVAVFDLQSGHYTFVNEAAEQLLGYPPEQILEAHFSFFVQLIHPDDLVRVSTVARAALTRAEAAGADGRHAKPEIIEAEYRVRHASGQWRWLRTSGRVFDYLPDGRVHHVLNITLDVTELKQAQEALLDSQQKLEARVAERTNRLEEQKNLLESILNSMSDGVLVADRSARLVVYNRAAREVMGLDKDHPAVGDWRRMTGTMHADGVTPYKPSERPLLRALRGETVQDAEILFKGPDGKESWITANTSPLFDEHGKLRGGVAVFRDNSERQKAEMALRESLERFNLMVTGSGVGLWDCQVDAKDPFNPQNPIYYSSRLKELLGFADDEFEGVLGSWAARVHPDDAPRVFKALEDHLFRRTPYETEQRVYTKSGELRWFQARGQAVWDENGSPVRMSGSFADITDRKRAEEQLVESERRMLSIMEGTPSIVYIKDLTGRYVFANEAYRRVFGGASNPIVGQFDTDFFPADVAAAFRANDLQVLASNEPQHLEEQAWQDGELRTYLSVKFRLIGADGQPYALCGISTDIHDRKLAEEKLRDEQNFLRRMLDAHERDRQLIAYDLHDGLVQDIAAAGMYFNSVDRSLTSLNPTERQTFDQAMNLLRAAISDGRRVLSGLRPPILDEQGIVMALHYLAVEQSVPGELEVRVSADVAFTRLEPLLEGTIYRIVQESLTNVKRHSRSHEAEVFLMQVGDRLTLIVQDWGIGFDPARVPADHFGLEGIRKRAALLGGQAEIDSGPNRGTRIAIEFPIRVRERPPATGEQYLG